MDFVVGLFVCYLVVHFFIKEKYILLIRILNIGVLFVCFALSEPFCFLFK